MMPSRRGLLKEPLVQFIAIGAMIAGLYALTEEGGDPSAALPRERIVVDEGRLDTLRQRFAGTWQRSPTPQELDGLVDAFVREEVLARAGRQMGLGEDDPVIRRRLAQKMAFLLEPDPDTIEPADDDLQKLLDASPERYRTPAAVSLRQVLISPAAHDDPGANAAQTMRALKAGAQPGDVGDRTLLPEQLTDANVGDIARQFGSEFAERLPSLPRDVWTGPVRSAYGLHVVRIDAYRAPETPALAEVRHAVRRDWTVRRREEIAQERFDALKERYEIVIAPVAEGERVSVGADETSQR